ncbi:hypothetical protein ATL39_1778 [Sinobaca qinghaiensis]|uniref:Uncharacterized protein n=1 Tax=Sinobaca qinghaiensis TaxID=342944 RepID=A0A419V4S4_9BACL|nr:hypothetical protein [Sinobaca qinghaiensis]RKD73483.1 hypothetical protein ATL39_1778 [Sinobaca qinghaiensis]
MKSSKFKLFLVLVWILLGVWNLGLAAAVYFIVGNFIWTLAHVLAGLMFLAVSVWVKKKNTI